MTEHSHQLSERHTADFEMIANGGFAPADRLPGLRGLQRVCEEMRTDLRRVLADPDHPCDAISTAAEGDVVELTSDEGKALGRLRVEEVFERDGKQGGRARLRHDRRRPPRRRRDLRGGRPLPGRPDRGRRAARPRGRLHAPLPHPRGVAQGLRRPRLEAGRRLPDPQPDPPRPRVPDQGRAGDDRRPLHPPADRQDQGRRHPRRRADALLRGPDGELLPARTA